MQPVQPLSLFFMIAVVPIVLEALIQYAKTIYNMIAKKQYKTAITQGVAIILGVSLAFAFNLQLFNQVLSQVYPEINIDPIIDTILTGILFSRGSNYFSDLVKRLTTIGGKDGNIQIMVDDGSGMEKFLSGKEEK